jgi:hypothetical protein
MERAIVYVDGFNFYFGQSKKSYHHNLEEKEWLYHQKL